MRQKTAFTVGPQMRIEGFDTLLRSPLHDHTPSPRDGFFKQGWENVFDRLALQVIEEDFSHGHARLWSRFVVIRHQLVKQANTEARAPAPVYVRLRRPHPGARNIEVRPWRLIDKPQ